MATLEQYAVRPNTVDVFAVGSSYTDVILRKDIKETIVPATTSPDGSQTTEETTVWQCEERQLRVPSVLTAEDVTADFDTWWAYTDGTKTAATQPTNAERIAALEAAVLELGEVLANG